MVRQAIPDWWGLLPQSPYDSYNPMIVVRKWPILSQSVLGDIWRHWKHLSQTMHESLLFIVSSKVTRLGSRTLRPDNVWFIAIYSKSKGHSVGVVLLGQTMHESLLFLVKGVAKLRLTDASMTHRCLPGKCCQRRQRSPSTLWLRIDHFLTTNPDSIYIK